MHTTFSRRKADELITAGQVFVNGKLANPGIRVEENDKVIINGIQVHKSNQEREILLLNKPKGYICSHDGQGYPTVFDLLPPKYANFKIAGRLDLYSSGLLILTNDGDLLNQLTHPSNGKIKQYTVKINKTIDKELLESLKRGVNIGDKRPSKITINKIVDSQTLEVSLKEGRNRQIRRTFEALGYNVIGLQRFAIGKFRLDNIKTASYKSLPATDFSN